MMKCYVVLFRGINVGGNNILPMKELVALLTDNGFESVTSYIQTGNIVLKCNANPEEKIAKLVNEHYDFHPQTFVMTSDEFMQAKNQNPFVEGEGKYVHFYFCKNSQDVDFDKLEQLKSASEEYQLINNVFYLHAPDGIGRSKLAAKVEACISSPTTARNLNTINKLTEIIAKTKISNK